MPELAELKLTADYINEKVKNLIFHKVVKNTEHKGQEINLDSPFVIEAQNRGKELMLTISTAPEFVTDQIEVKHLMMGMGMSGHFKWLQPGSIEKHAHLMFKTESAGVLAFVDVRRFGKWKWGFWNKDRGPDPIVDFQNFIRNIKTNIDKKDFDKPIHEVLMNQRWFNGIGNYLRAEILYRTDCNPFISAREALQKYPEIYQLCKLLPLQAYKLGGGQLKDWENPFGTMANVDSWSEFMICYGNPKMSKITDRNGRTFWFNSIWQESNI